jgi:diguanylate cyclase (GGDEF)-like protein
MVGLFVLSALIPLSVCTLFLIRELGGQLNRTQQQNLDSVVRGFGVSLAGRLGSADDVLGTIMSRPDATDADIIGQVSKLEWVRSVQSVKVADLSGFVGGDVPIPDPHQLSALSAKAPVVLSGPARSPVSPVFLLRELPSGAWLYVELSASWLWSDVDEYANGTGVVILDGRGERIASAGSLPRSLRLQWSTIPATGRSAGDHEIRLPEELRGRLQLASWELFLAGRFSTASWHVVAVRERPTLVSGGSVYNLFLFAFILLTILLVAWLSMTAIRRQLEPLAVLTQATRRIARRDFAALPDASWKDEFGDLARAFSAMSDQLRMQFSALETLSEIDRLLLHAPELESILNTLLPRIAEVMHCDSVSVLLFDPDSPGHARAYDYYRSQSSQPRVRRIAAGVAELRTALAGSKSPLFDSENAESAFLQPFMVRGILTVQLHTLYRGDSCAGALCIGRTKQDPGDHSGLGAGDFADRLSLILASLEQSAALHRQANFDPLTGLQNRQLFSAQLLKAVAAARAAHGIGALLYIDLDQFKHVNDTAGHGAGDRLLRAVGERLTGNATDGRSVARLSGDEFAVLLPRIATPEGAWQTAISIIAALEEPIETDDRQHRISASLGITIFPQDGTTLEQLFRSGDIAMYQAKESGRGRAVFFEVEMQQALQRRVALVNAMHQALQHGGFVVHYQPIVSERAREGIAVEALARWPGNSADDWIPPATFIPIAEETGQIIKLGEWVLRTACEQFERWRAEGVGISYVSVNVSVRQLSQADFASRLRAILAQTRMRGRELQIELTESVLACGAQLEQTLQEIVAQGVRVALDDFGTGYSSLSYLSRFPIHTVKIDRSFVQELPDDSAACRLTESIIAMCGVLGKDVVAEGVETQAQQGFLRSAGCTTIQGYLVARPMEAAGIPGFLRGLRADSTPRVSARA